MAGLRVFLLVLFGVLVMFQFVSLPGQFAYMAEQDPEHAYLRWPATAVTVFWVLCVQVVIVCTWQLLTMVKEDRIFSEASMVWVDVIVGAMATAWLLLLGTLLYVAAPGGPPGPAVAPLVLLLVAGAVVGLLMVVMRALLRQATSLRTDLESVI